MSYIEADLIIEGALEQTHQFDDESALKSWVQNLEAESDAEKASTGTVEKWEVHTVDHDHELDGEDCTCVQYQTDHYPYWRNWDELR